MATYRRLNVGDGNSWFFQESGFIFWHVCSSYFTSKSPFSIQTVFSLGMVKFVDLG
jgi:hypothetical protein